MHISLPLCSWKEYRGSARRARGLKRLAKSPPLSGGEVARKTEEKGRGLSERSEFRRPRRRPWRRTQKPDNCGGASWFVLLAVEKNEQINDLFQPLSSETAVPSVSPLYFPTETQGRRIIVFCISVFGVVQMSRREIRWKFGQPKKVRRRWRQFYEGRAVSLLYKSFDTALWGLAVTICDFSERSFRSCFKFIEK